MCEWEREERESEIWCCEPVTCLGPFWKPDAKAAEAQSSTCGKIQAQTDSTTKRTKSELQDYSYHFKAPHTSLFHMVEKCGLIYMRLIKYLHYFGQRWALLCIIRLLYKHICIWIFLFIDNFLLGFFCCLGSTHKHPCLLDAVHALKHNQLKQK